MRKTFLAELEHQDRRNRLDDGIGAIYVLTNIVRVAAEYYEPSIRETGAKIETEEMPGYPER